MSWYYKFIGLTSSLALVSAMALGQSAQINRIGDEEFVSSDFMDRPSVATDSKNQPHFVCDAGGNSRFMKYDKVNGKWYGGVFAVGSKGGRYNASRLYIGQIEIDSKDRSWISCKFGCKEYGTMLGQGVWCFRDVATDPTPSEQFFRHVNVYKGMGVVTTDAKYPDQGIVIGTFGNYNIIYSTGSVIAEGSINAGHGGEKVRARVGSFAPRFPVKGDKTVYPDGIWHTAMNGSHSISSSYQNSLRYKAGKGPVTWADYGAYRIMGDDYHHPGIMPDLSDPNVCYITTVFYGKMCINIWDGTKMLIPTSFLKVLDSDCTFESRHGSAIAPAPGPSGGAFFFWTKAGMIKTCYVSKKGVAGKIMDVTPGRTAAAATDRDGNIHLVYYNNGSRYRKIFVSTLDALSPTGIVTDRTPAFRWSNTKAASYTIELTRDGVKQPLIPVSGAVTWTPSSDLDVGDYSWRVKEGGAFSASPYSPAKAFDVTPVTPETVAPAGRTASAPSTPTFEWTGTDPTTTRYTIELVQGTEVLGTLNVSSNSHTIDWTAPLPAGFYSWHVRATRVLAGHTVFSPYSEDLSFQIGVPGLTTITRPEATDDFNPGVQTIGFSWSGAEGATAYKLKVLHNGSVFDSRFNIADTNASMNANFWPGYYTALVQPQNGDGNGMWSEPVTFEVNREMRPTGDNTLDQTPASFRWSRSKDATKYLLKVMMYNQSSRRYEAVHERWVSQVPSGATPSWTPSVDLENGAYRWSVTDYAGSKANYTSVSYFQVKVPGRPSLIAPSGDVGHTVELVWEDPSEAATQFQIVVWNDGVKVRDTGFLPAADLLKSPGVYSKTFGFDDSRLGGCILRIQGKNNKGLGPWRDGSFNLVP